MLKLTRVCFLSIGILCTALIAVADEGPAPVVDINQDTAANTQAVPQTSGWQAVSTPSPANSVNTAPLSATSPVSTLTQQVPVQQGVGMPSSPQNVTPQQAFQSSQTQLPMDQRVSRLEQQMSNTTQMNLPQQLSDLQQKVSQLEGQLQIQQHDLQTTQTQQKSLYQDLSNRILSGSSSASSDTEEQPTTLQTTASADDTGAYGKAFQLLSEKHFSDSEKSFKQYLITYPKGQFAVNAHFWMGEIALMDQRYDQAKKEFKAVITQYPKSNKVPDARLKIAMIHAATGNVDKARAEFTKIKKDYPGSTAAQLASIRLQQLDAGTNNN